MKLQNNGDLPCVKKNIIHVLTYFLSIIRKKVLISSGKMGKYCDWSGTDGANACKKKICNARSGKSVQHFKSKKNMARWESESMEKWGFLVKMDRRTDNMLWSMEDFVWGGATSKINDVIFL